MEMVAGGGEGTCRRQDLACWLAEADGGGWLRLTYLGSDHHTYIQSPLYHCTFGSDSNGTFGSIIG